MLRVQRKRSFKKLKNKFGKRKTLFRLKDWGVSRQRYWGCPIPMIYLEDGSIVPVEKDELPIELPQDIDLNSNGNPLDTHPNWKNTVQKSTGKKAVRETDTLDTFVDSSWYFLRFCSPKYYNAPFEVRQNKILDARRPIYRRYRTCDFTFTLFKVFTKAINKFNKSFQYQSRLKICSLKVWFVMSLIRTMMVIGFTLTRLKKTKTVHLLILKIKKSDCWTCWSMSKSKKNTIDPEVMIDQYGADAVRWFILSDSPPEKDVQWSNTGVASANKFLQKIWNLNFLVNKRKVQSIDKNLTEKFNSELNIFINKIDSSIKNFRFNVSIAHFYELYKFFRGYSDTKIDNKILIIGLSNMMKMMIPFTPHLAHECLELLNCKTISEWPKIDSKDNVLEKIKIAVQINGKTRDILTVQKDLVESEINKIILVD